MNVSNAALARVVQIEIIPSSHSSIVRMRYAPQMASRKTTISSPETENVGLKISVKPAAIGR